MADYTVKRIDEMEGAYGGAFKRVRAELGVTSFGMAIIDMPPNFEHYPTHDHARDGQEEVFLALRGGGEIEIAGERHALDSEHAVRVPPASIARSSPVPTDPRARARRQARRGLRGPGGSTSARPTRSRSRSRNRHTCGRRRPPGEDTACVAYFVREQARTMPGGMPAIAGPVRQGTCADSRAAREHPLDVGVRLGKRDSGHVEPFAARARLPPPIGRRFLAAVVCGEREHLVAAVAVEQEAQVTAAVGDVDLGGCEVVGRERGSHRIGRR